MPFYATRYHCWAPTEREAMKRHRTIRRARSRAKRAAAKRAAD